MRLSLGCDHGAYELKDAIKEWLLSEGHDVIDEGTNGPESCNYPEFAKKAALDVKEGRADMGFLFCTTGEGVAICANKVKGIRCGIGYNDVVAEKTRSHNNCNMLAFGAAFTSYEEAKARIQIFLATPFEGGRHETRVNMISDIENN